jgi:hypothetical protein
MATTTNPSLSGSSGTDASGQRLSDAASSVASQAERAVGVKASGAMQQAGGTLQEVAEAIRGAGQNIGDQQPQIQGFADTAARQLDRAAAYLQDHEPRELIDEVQGMARRQPGLVIAGGLAVGLALGRLLRTAGSTPGSRSEYGTARNGMAHYGYSGGSPGTYRTGMPVGPGRGSSSGYGSSEAAASGTDPGASVIASTKVVEVGGGVDTGRSGDASRS